MEKINKVKNIIFNTPIFSIIIGLMIFGKTFLFYNSTIAISEPLEANTIIGTLSFITAIVCFERILPNKARKIVTILMDVLISVLLFCDNIYYSYSSSFISVAQISNLQYGEEILKTVPTLLNLSQILYFIDIFVIIILIIIWKTKKLKIKKIENKELKKEKSQIREIENKKIEFKKVNRKYRKT